MVKRILKESLEEIGARHVLNLYSGISCIGNVRVDISTEQATWKGDVLDFIRLEHSPNYFDAAIADPPYEIDSKDKLAAYGRVSSVAANVPLRRELFPWLAGHCDNLFWLDLCAPFPAVMKQAGFRRRKLWILLPGGMHSVRVLTWLQKGGDSNP